MKIVYLPLLLVLLVSACGTDTSSGSKSTDTPGDNGSTTNEVTVSLVNNPDSSNPQPVTTPIQQVSRLSVNITDAPLVDVAKVVVTLLSFEFIREHPSQSLKFTFNTPKQIDLLALQGSTSETLVSDIDVEAGEYKELRVVVDDTDMSSYVELSDGSVHTLKIPGGSSSGLKIRGDFEFEEDKTSAYTIDFDLAKSLILAGSSDTYILKPVLRVVENSEVGHIRGKVNPSLLTSSECTDSDVDSYNAVYVFTGGDVTPTDINVNSDSDKQPITTTLIRYDRRSGGYIYEAAYLPAGEYTVAFTCSADLDDPEVDDDLPFFDAFSVKVQINNILFL